MAGALQTGQARRRQNTQLCHRQGDHGKISEKEQSGLDSRIGQNRLAAFSPVNFFFSIAL
jgi:hypothetical protein